MLRGRDRCVLRADVGRCLAWVLSVLTVGCDLDPGGPGFETVRAWSVPETLAAIDLSRDGGAVVLGLARGESSLWTAPWKLSVVFDRADQPLLAARFDDQEHLNFARADGSVEVRASSGAIVLETKLGEGATQARAVFSPSGRFVAFGESVYQLRGRRLVARAGTGAAPSALEIASDQLGLVGGPGPELTVLALSGQAERRLRAADGVTAAAISGDGRLVAAGTRSGVEIWRDERVEPYCRQAAPGPVDALRFSGSARWLAIASGHELWVLRANDCEPLARLALQARARVLDTDADLIAVGDAGGRIYVWDVFNARWLGRAPVFDAPVLAVRIHAGSRLVLAAADRSEGGEARLLHAVGR